MGFPSKQRERDWLVVSLSPPDGKKRPWMRSTGPEWQNPTRFYPHPYAKRPLLPRRHKPRRKNKKSIMNRVPCAPYNTSSYLMRAGKLGVNAPLLSPATPALETPVVSPSPWPSESLGDCEVAKELGVNAYGSMNGRIRLRSDDMDRDSGSSSCGESDTEHCDRHPADSVQQVEERINHGLQRFEILYNADSPLRPHGVVSDEETHIQHLEEENLSLQQRLWAMSQELSHLRRRLGHDDEFGVVSDESLGNGSCAV
ncbi:hypothetical protein M758_9G129500 [Ceratodon purpureus]|uniref:PRLI-interacting factor A n=1 Tax=Ceratodon purpureus TaxID=3225 RepID=A0A8T0GYS4_CERPU|nr:hypothetical protein KC19_9G114800 [Ceratodon purpureus]KAG0606293.1 hypothetical protein M758_9G129500 [Ceratodon purpureus]